MNHKAGALLKYVLPSLAFYSCVLYFLAYRSLPDLKQLEFSIKAAAILGLASAGALAIAPRSFKEFLVFWRLQSRLPGFRAFTSEFDKCDRYDLSDNVKFNELRQLNPYNQQRRFYNIYVKHSRENRVEEPSARYVGWREACVIWVLLAVITGVFAATGMFVMSLGASLAAIVVTLVGYFISLLAARASANDLIRSVHFFEFQENDRGVCG